ncbi:MAG TPA: sigma-70 family RNA polymerase sigma factor [Lacunisphaera sp.]
MNAFLPSSSTDDERLIRLHLAGDAAAFRQIVERHQGLVCALAYSACGDVARSEDIAQEVFIAAWKQLPQLREPAKLRGWLCGITRNLGHNALRRAERTPTARAAELPADLSAEAPDPREHAMGADEAGLIWGALGGLPESYREPMVLFYREGQSVAMVATALDVSEETVRQRLARGRAMLTERVAKLVERTLERSAPTPAFAGAVMLALPGPLAPAVIEALGGEAGSKTLAAAGAAGSVAAKGGLVFKFLSVVAFLPALLQGVEDYIRFNDRNAGQKDAVARREAAKAYLMMHAGIGLFVIGFLTVPNLASPSFSPFLIPISALCGVVGIWVSVRAKCRMKRMQGQLPSAGVVRHGIEQRSAASLLGLPLYHVRLGTRPPRHAPTVKGWIAISDGRALGGLFAFGPIAVAPFSMGLVGVGIGSVSIVSLGGLAALGIVAAGWWSAGLVAVGGFAAQALWAAAPQFTSGASAWAVHAGDEAARAFFHAHWFYRFTSASAWVLMWAGLLGWVMPVVLASWKLWRTRESVVRN